MSDFIVGGKAYSQADILAMPIQDFTALRRQYDEEQRDGPDPKTLTKEETEEAVAVQDARIRREPVVEPEVQHEVTFSFVSSVLGNSMSIERNVEKSRQEVKRILDRSLHADVDVHTERTVIKVRDTIVENVDAWEGRVFEGDVRQGDMGVGVFPTEASRRTGLPKHGFDCT